MTNYEIFINTVNTLKSSQGIYSRIAAQLRDMDESAREDLKQELNKLPAWRDPLDCIFFIEG